MATPLECIVIEPEGIPDAAVIWMHGLGADGQDFEPIVPDLNPRESIRARFIFPHAPHRPISINRGYVMRGWYDIYELGSLEREDNAGVRESAAAIEALIQTQLDAGIAARRIVLAGFSQGAAMALHTALRYPHALAGVVALSGYLPLAPTFESEAHAANARTPIFLAHGTGDDIVPLRSGERTRDTLLRLGYDVTWRTYDMPHSICPKEIRDIAEFLMRVLA